MLKSASPSHWQISIFGGLEFQALLVSIFGSFKLRKSSGAYWYGSVEPAVEFQAQWMLEGPFKMFGWATVL